MTYVKTELNQHVLTVYLNRPEKKNAFHLEMIQKIRTIFQSIPESVRVVLLKSHGDVFSSGADLNWMKESLMQSEEENKKDANELFLMFQAVSECSKPLIARVQGSVMGGAMGLVALSDVVLAEEKTLWSLSEVRVGLVPAVIGPYLLRKTVKNFMIPYMLSGLVFNSNEACKMGLTQFVGTDTELDFEEKRWIEAFKKTSPQSTFETKKWINEILQTSQDEVLNKKGIELIAKVRVSPEGQEGLKAFFEKRLPSWIERI